MKKIQIFGCGDSGQDVLDSRLLNEMGVEKVTVATDNQLKFEVISGDEIQKFEAKGDKILSLETSYSGLGELPFQYAEEAAMKESSEINDLIDGDVLFLACEMGIDPCAGYMPTLASVARDQGVFSIAVAHTILPFRLREEHTRLWISKLEKSTDLFIFIPFDALTEAIPQYTIKEGYQLLVQIVARVIRDLSNLIQCHGRREKKSFLDDKYLLEIIRESSKSRAGFGVAHGKDAYMESVEKALKCPLLDFKLKEAGMVIVIITGDLDLYEAERMILEVAETAGDETIILWDIFSDNHGNNNIETLILALKGDKPSIDIKNVIEEAFKSK